MASINTMFFNPSLARRYTGNGFIAGSGAGIVTVAGSPAKRRVVLFDAGSLRLVRVTSSNANGEYLFPYLNQNRRFVVAAFDDQNQFNAVIRDNVTPAPMT